MRKYYLLGYSLMNLFMCAPHLSIAQTEVRKYSNDFLRVGIGARAAGMGNAQTAFVSDVTAAYWNPAGLVHAPKRHEVGLMHSEQFAGVIKYDYLGFSTEFDPGRRLALSAIRLGIDNIPNTLNFREGDTYDYARITEFSVADLAVLVSYAQRVKGIEGLSVGGNFKVINRTIGDFATAWGFGLDVGAQYRRKNLMLGAMASDVSGTFNAWTFNTELFEGVFAATGNEIPQNSVEVTAPELRLGGAYRFFSSRAIHFAASLDANLSFDGRRNTVLGSGVVSVDPRLGLEATYKNIVFVRAGAMNAQFIENDEGNERLNMFPTAGLGFAYKAFAVDYSLSNITGFQNNLYSHLISLKISFNNLQL